jgi:beta-glucanase (GH16 family)
VNTKGEGFAQQYGYFEMNARYDYPADPKGLWTGFWLKSQRDYFDQGATRVEIDINEFYGDDGYHPTVHLWPASKLTPESAITKRVGASGFKEKVAPKLFAPLKEAGDGVVKGFHTYGGEITPEWVIMYFDHKELARFPTVVEFKTPLYMLVTNDTRKIKPEEEPSAPLDMIVKHIAVYQLITPYAGK